MSWMDVVLAAIHPRCIVCSNLCDDCAHKVKTREYTCASRLLRPQIKERDEIYGIDKTHRSRWNN